MTLRKLIPLLILVLFIPSIALSQVSVYFDNFTSGSGLDPLIDTLPVDTTFTAEVWLDSSAGNLQGAHIAIIPDPSALISVDTITSPIAPADYDILKIDDQIQNRLLWFKNGGLATNPLHIADVSFTVIGSTNIPSARIRINVLQILAAGSTNPLTHTVAIPEIDMELREEDPVITPTPTPEATATAIITPYDGDESSALYTVYGGCSLVDGNSPKANVPTGFILLFMGLITILARRSKPGKSLLISFILILLMTFISDLSAETYYVDNTDPDCVSTYSGDPGAPFCNISDAIAQRLIPGDIIEVKAAYDRNESSTLRLDDAINGQGVIGIPIILRGEDTGATPTAEIKNAGSFAVIGIQGEASYWAIENLMISNGGPWTPAYGDQAEAAAIAGDDAGKGIIIRNNLFEGTIDDGRYSDIVRINSFGSLFSNYSNGHLIENNTFQNYSIGGGYAFVNLQRSSYSIIRGNTIIHNNASTSPWRHISIDNGSRNIVERNFSAGSFADDNNSSNISSISQSSPYSIVRNNILYMEADQDGSASGLRGMSPIRVIGGGSHVIHNNSALVDIVGGADERRISGIYAGTHSSTTYAVNNVLVGGEYCAAGIYRFDYSSINANFNIDYNDCYGYTVEDHMPQIIVDGDNTDYACYLGWYYDYPAPDGSGAVTQVECEAVDTAGTYNTYNNTDAVDPFTGGDPYSSASYTLAGASDAANMTWSTDPICTSLTGEPVACDGGAGAYEGANPYGTSTGFTFCGDAYGPSGDPDRVLDLRDVVTLWGSDAALSTAVAQYLVTLNPLVDIEDPDNNIYWGDPLPSGCFSTYTAY